MLDNDNIEHAGRARALLQIAEHFCKAGSWELDRKGKVVWWSEQMLHLHGLKKDNLPLTTEEWLRFTSDDDRVHIGAQFRQILQGETDHFSAEYQWRSDASQEVRNFRIFGEAVVTDGAVSGIRGIVEDLTSSVASHEKTKEAENRVSMILHNLPAPVAIWRREGDDFVLAESNAALNTLTDGGSAASLGRLASVILADYPEMLESMQRCFVTSSIVSLEKKEWKSADAVDRNYLTNFIRVGDEVVVSSVDTTARKEIERALVDNERQYREFFENSQAGLCLLDENRCIKTANTTLLKAMGYQLEEIKGRLFLEFVDDAYRSRAKEYVSTAFGSIIPRELSLVTKDNSRLFVLISTRTISEEGSTESSLIEITDITNLKQTERNLLRLQRELEEAQDEGDKKEAALTAVLSHLENEKSNYKKQVHHRFYRAINPYLEHLKSGENLSEAEVKEMEEAILDSLDHDVDDFEMQRNNLSPKEQQICEEIASGMTSKEISDKMYLSVETVRKHRKSIRRKLKLTNRGANLTTYLRQHIKSDD